MLNSLDNRLYGKLRRGSYQALTLYGVTGASLRLRSCSANTRPHDVWQPLSRWDKHLFHQTQDAPYWLQDWSWSDLLHFRLERDTDRALTQAVYNHVTGGKTALPEDPFAPQAGMQIKRRDLPGGVVLWYSVGANGKDDGGDFRKDITVRLMPTK
ncbi:MAG: hypothetical protein H7Y38_01875 [Armatimonadetes bacterium]|nr:hypothetical protein [Armatimonadota bacterium]